MEWVSTLGQSPKAMTAEFTTTFSMKGFVASSVPTLHVKASPARAADA